MQKDSSAYLKSTSPHQPKKVVSGQVEYVRMNKTPDENASLDEKYIPFKRINTIAQFLDGCDDIGKTVHSIKFGSTCLQEDYIPEGLDKIELTLDRVFVNEHCYLFKSLKNGNVTLRSHAQYFFIIIHRECINLKENLLGQVRDIIRQLMNEGLFKNPQYKIISDYSTGEILSEKDYSGNDIRNGEDLLTLIMSNLSLNCIEWFCDIHRKGGVSDLFNLNQFNVLDSTLYSMDYKYYKSNCSRKNSLLCIYDKSAQLKKVKNLSMNDETTRMELRLNKKSFHRTMFKSLTILNGNYDDFTMKIQKHLVRKVKKLNISFGKFISSCELPLSFRTLLEKVSNPTKRIRRNSMLSKKAISSKRIVNTIKSGNEYDKNKNTKNIVLKLNMDKELETTIEEEKKSNKESSIELNREDSKSRESKSSIDSSRSIKLNKESCNKGVYKKVDRVKSNREERNSKNCCVIKTPYRYDDFGKQNEGNGRGLTSYSASRLSGMWNWVKKYSAKKGYEAKTLLFHIKSLYFSCLRVYRNHSKALFLAMLKLGRGVGCLYGFSLYEKNCCAIKIYGSPPIGMFHVRGP